MALSKIVADSIQPSAITEIALGNTGVTAGTYGNTTAIPVITVDADGRITNATTNAHVSANATTAGIIQVVDSVTNTSITVAASANSVTNAYDRAIDANTRAYSAQTAAAAAYTNAVAYAASNTYVNTTFATNTYVNSTFATNTYVNSTFAPKAGPTFTGTAAFADITVSGNLTTSGTTTYVNTTNLNVGDNIVTLNADLGASAPTENAGIEVNRGTSANVALRWNETTDKWETTVDGTNYLTVATNNDVSTAYSNAVAYAAANSYVNTQLNLKADLTGATFSGGVSGITTLAAGNTTITGFANVTSSLQVGNNVYVAANGNVGIGDSTPTLKFIVTGGVGYFANGLGVGTGSVTTNRLRAQYNVSDVSATTSTLLSDGTHTLTADNAVAYQAVDAQAALNQGASNATISLASGGSVRGLRNYVTVTGASGTVTAAIGTLADIRNLSTGVVTNAAGFVTSFTNSGGGTLNNTYGFYAGAATAGANNFGFYGALANAAGRYNLYMAGTADNYMSGNTGIGNTTPAHKLSVNGTAYFGSSVNVATTFAAGNTTITGFANVTSSIQGGGSLTVAGALSGVTTAAMGNTTITGTALVSGDLTLNTNATYIKMVTPGNSSTRVFGINSSNSMYIGAIDTPVAATFLNTATGSGPLFVYANGAAVASALSNGNFGVGNTTPAHKLSVSGVTYLGGNTTVSGNLVMGSTTTIDANAQIYNTANRPTIRPTLNLDFAGSKSVDSRITFTRASSATYYAANGMLLPSYNDQPRIEFNPATGECKGLLIEEQRTNLFSYTDQFDNSYWTKYPSTTAVLPNVIVAPDGTFTADQVIGTTSNYEVNKALTKAASAITYTLSGYLKAGSTSIVQVTLSDNTTGQASISFNVSTGAISTAAANGTWSGASGTINSVGNGWYRCTLTATSPTNTGLLPTFNGTGGAGNFYLWGAQLEVGAFATSYIPSTTAFTSRASSATYFDSTGVLRIAGTNQARYGYGFDAAANTWISQGLLVEPAATNIQAYADLPSSWVGTEGLASKNTVLGVDGRYSAVKIVEDTGNSRHRTYPLNVNFTNGTIYTASCYAKAGSAGRYLVINCGSAFGPIAGFNLSTGVVGAVTGGTASITPIGNGWYRCSVTGTCTSTHGDQFLMQIQQGFTDVSYIGDGSSYIYVSHPQVETGYVATSYIPTYGSSVTRAADSVSSSATTRALEVAAISGSNFSSWFNPSAGTLYADVNPTYVYGGAGYVYPKTVTFVGANADTDSIGLYRGTGSGQNYYGGLVYVSGASYYDQSIIPANNIIRSAIAYATNNTSHAVNGVVATTDTSVTLPKLQELRLFGTGTYQSMQSGYVKKVSYYPVRLTNAEIQGLTK